MAEIIRLGAAEHLPRLIARNAVVLVDFRADWCAPCRKLGAVLEEAARLASAGTVVVCIDVDKFPELAAQYGVTAIPLLIQFRNGAEKKRLTGNQKLDAVLPLLE